MFGMTNRQFLKRSKKALEETGVQILALRGLMNQEANAHISITDAIRRLDMLRKDVENTFSTYEKLEPPSECFNLHQEMLNGLILFFESIVSYLEYLHANEDNSQTENSELLMKSNENLQKYQELSLKLSREVDSNLSKKIK